MTSQPPAGPPRRETQVVLAGDPWGDSGPHRGRTQAGAGGVWFVACEGEGGEGWVDDALACHDAPDRDGEFFRRVVLDDESPGAGFHRTPQVSRAAEGGEDERAAVREFPGQESGGRQAVDPRHVDVEERDIGLAVPDDGGHLVTAADRSHDLEVRLQPEQRGEGGTEQFLTTLFNGSLVILYRGQSTPTSVRA